MELSSEIPKRVWNFRQNEYRNINIWSWNIPSEYSWDIFYEKMYDCVTATS